MPIQRAQPAMILTAVEIRALTPGRRRFRTGNALQFRVGGSPLKAVNTRNNRRAYAEIHGTLCGTKLFLFRVFTGISAYFRITAKKYLGGGLGKANAPPAVGPNGCVTLQPARNSFPLPLPRQRRHLMSGSGSGTQAGMRAGVPLIALL
jgi:hypothetical protein